MGEDTEVILTNPVVLWHNIWFREGFSSGWFRVRDSGVERGIIFKIFLNNLIQNLNYVWEDFKSLLF